MASKTIKMVFQFRRATAAEWAQYPDVVPAAGEPCFVTDENVLKIGDGETTFANLKPINGVNAEVTADGKSIVLEDNIFQLMGFNEAEVNAQPRKAADGSIEWIVPSTETVEGLQTTVAGLQSDVVALQKAVGATEEGAATIMDRVASVEEAVEILNGEGTVEGSVKKIVDEAINKFATDASNDDVVNSYKELIDYAADHGAEFTELVGVVDTNTKAIATLNGDATTAGSVDKKIADAIAGENLGQYAKDADLDAAVERIGTAEGEIDTLQAEMDAVEAKAADNEQAIATANTEIAKKAAQTDLEAAITRIANNEAEIASFVEISETEINNLFA
jgi:hypothetical protein